MAEEYTSWKGAAPSKRGAAVMSTFAWCYKGCLTPDNRRLVVAGLYGLRGPSGTGLTAEGRKLLRLRTATGRAFEPAPSPYFPFSTLSPETPSSKTRFQQPRFGLRDRRFAGRSVPASPPALAMAYESGAPCAAAGFRGNCSCTSSAAVGFQTTSRRNARRRGGGPGEIATARSRMSGNRTPPFPRISTP